MICMSVIGHMLICSCENVFINHICSFLLLSPIRPKICRSLTVIIPCFGEEGPCRDSLLAPMGRW